MVTVDAAGANFSYKSVQNTIFHYFQPFNIIVMRIIVRNEHLRKNWSINRDVTFIH